VKSQIKTLFSAFRSGPITWAILLCGLVGSSFYPAQAQDTTTVKPPAGVVSSTQNPLQVALLHWYSANQTAAFTTGSGPYGIAFDGASLWISNFSANNVVKMRPSDGTILGTFPVGTNPIAVAYDGASVWVANINSNNVTKLNGSTGALIGTFTVGTQPDALAFDGTNIWVTNDGSNNVTQLQASTGQDLGDVRSGHESRWCGV